MSTGRALTVGALLTAILVVAGCSGEPTNSDGTSAPPSTSSSAPSAPSTPTHTPGADAKADEALLPMPVDDIRAWAEKSVPNSDSPGWAFGLSGWMGESSAHQKSTYESLEPGAFQAQIACRGDGEITLTAGELDGEGSSEPVRCTNETIAFDVTTTRTGIQMQFDSEGAPSIYAVSLLRVS